VTAVVLLTELEARWPIEIDRTFGCALWTGARDKRDGRALQWRGGKPAQAQRLVYEAEVEPVGVDEHDVPRELDHMCRRSHCVAPHHAEPVTRSENERRKSPHYRWKRLRCPLGHDLSLHGTITPEGGRVCRTCNRQALGETR